MATPQVEVTQRSIGRYGDFTAKIAWTQSESDNLDAAVLLDLDTTGGRYTNPRFAITKLEWSGSEVVSADIEFASLPWTSDNIIVTIPAGTGSGEIDWRNHVSGKANEPNADTPGNVVITTRNALPGDELFITGTYMEKGVPTRVTP